MMWGKFWRLIGQPLPLMAVLGVSLGAFLVGGAVYSDDRGLFGDVTAAWVQAVGSVGAIIAAIVIDQGASRRLEKQRTEEHARAVSLRIKAIGECKDSLERLADRLVETEGQKGELATDRIFLERVDRARKLLRRLLAQPAVYPEVDALELYADARMREVQKYLRDMEVVAPFAHLSQQRLHAGRIRSNSAKLNDAMAEWAAGLWRMSWQDE